MLLATVLAYSPALKAPFEFDDIESIANNVTIRQAWPPSVPLHPPPGIAVSGRPVVNYSLALDYALNEQLGVDQRPDPYGANKTVVFHITNILLHLACGALIFGILRRTLRIPRLAEEWSAHADTVAAIVTSLWFLHPIQSEAVNYLVQRTELLVSACYLGTLYAAVRAWGARSSRVRLGWYAAAIAMCLLGMGSKEVMLTAPLMVLLYDRAFASESWREVLSPRGGRRWFHATLAGTMLLSLYFILSGSRSGTVGFSLGMPWYQYLYSQAWAIAHYIQLVFWPSQLTFDYGQAPITGLRGIPGFMLLTVLGVATVVALVRKSPLSFVGAWFFLILAPSSSVVPISTEIAAERRLYLPIISVLVLLAIGAVRLLDRLDTESGDGARGWQSLLVRSPRWVFAALCVFLAGSTFQRSRTYADPVALWRDAVAKAPRNPRSLNSLALMLLQMNPPPVAEAEAVLRHAITLDSTYLPAWPNLALVVSRQGRAPEAKAVLEHVLAVSPNYVQAVERLGILLVDMGEPEAALHHLERVTAEYPREESLVALGRAYIEVGRPDQAEAPLRRAVQLDPAHTDAKVYLGLVLTELGHGADAIPMLEEVVKQDPGSGRALATLSLAYAKVGRVQEATAAALSAASGAGNDASILLLSGRTLLVVQRTPEAERLMESAVRHAPSNPEALTRLGMVKAALGKKNDAAELFRQTLVLKPDYPPALRAVEALKQPR